MEFEHQRYRRWVQGRSEGQFAPNDPATRAETAQFMLNYLK
ncbi:S-layer homology domain-containing protein [Fontibacillus panacisegetis]